MRFKDYAGVVEALADKPAGATVGQVQRMNVHLTRSQVQRVLENLVGEGTCIAESVQYRPHIASKIYHLTSEAVDMFDVICKKFDGCEHQLRFWENEAKK